MNVHLTSMDKNDFEQFLDISIIDYAGDKIKSGSWNKENALTNARRDFNLLLPKGIQTENHFLKNVVADNHKVGAVWYAFKKEDQQTIAYLYQIYVTPDCRSKGYGSLAMKVLKNEVSQLGINDIWLHVFGHNSKALSFYQQLGFRISDYTLNISLNS